MRRAVNADTHRRLARAKRVLESVGLRSLPGYDRLARGLRSIAFPALAEEADLVAVDIGGLVLDVPRAYLPHYLHRPYEPLTTDAFRAALWPGRHVVDVGVHIGYYTCLAARAIGPNGVVHAVEPASENVKVVRRNLNRNGLANAVVHEVAAAGQASIRTLRLTDTSGHHGLHSHPLSPTVATTTVRGVPVDDLVAGPVQLIKVDVEGAEEEVLRGMSRLLSKSPGATVIVEWNPEGQRIAGTRPETFPELLAELNVTELTVLDDAAGKILAVEDVRAAVAAGTTPHGWVGNLCGKVP